VKIGVVQFDIRLKQKERNLDKAVALTKRAAARGAEIGCLPSNFLSELSYNYASDELLEYAEPLDGPSLTAMSDVARDLGVYVVAGTVFEHFRSGVADTAALISPDAGVVGAYRRTHLVEEGGARETKLGVIAGSDYPVFEVLGFKIGIMIDIDLDYPEVARIYRLREADAIFYPSHCPSGYVDSHRFQTAARAYENQLFLVDVNRVGFSEDELYLGDSRVLSPKADVVVSAGKHDETVAVGEADISLVRRCREEFDLLAGRNLASYGDALVT
jgi:predicted amidohydrolase